MHVFDVDKDEQVISAWRELDQRTAEEGQKAKQYFFGNKATTTKPPVPKPRASSAPLKKDEPSETPSSVRFGEVSPPRSSLASSTTAHQSSSHTSRWVAYSALPGSFDRTSAPVSPTKEDGKSAEQAPSTTQVQEAQASSAKGVEAPNTFSTATDPTTLENKEEPQPSLEIPGGFIDHHGEASSSKVEESSYQPLLEMYERDLKQLRAEAAPLPSPSSPTVEPTADATLPVGEPSRPPTSGELLTQSLQSLLHGVGQLASAFKLTNSELQQQIAVAQKDFPQNIEKAFKASIAAIESLKLAIPADKISRGKKSAIAPNTLSNTASTTAAAQHLADAEEIRLQSERVDKAVENMRLRLLNDLKWTPSRVYTRADILEEFLAHFNKLHRSHSARKAASKESKASATAEAKSDAKTAAKNTRKSASGQDHPYATDLSFPPTTTPDLTVLRKRIQELERSRGQFSNSNNPYHFEPSAVLEVTPVTLPSLPPNAAGKPSTSAAEPSSKLDRARHSTDSYALLKCPYCSENFYSPDHVEHHVQNTHNQTKMPHHSLREPLLQPILFDQDVLQKYPTVSQMEGDYVGAAASAPPPTPPPRPTLRFMQQEARPVEEYDLPLWREQNQTSRNQPQVQPVSSFKAPRQDLYAKPTQRLSSQVSMPVLHGSQGRPAVSGAVPIPSGPGGLAWNEGAGRMRPIRSTGVLRSASNATRVARKADNTFAHPGGSGLGRSNTIAGPSSSYHYTPLRQYDADARFMSGRSANDSPETKASNIETCKRRLTEMGFDQSRAETVAEAVMGDLESAVDILEEDESARRQVKGKGRVMPGAFDEELYG